MQLCPTPFMGPTLGATRVWGLPWRLACLRLRLITNSAHYFRNTPPACLLSTIHPSSNPCLCYHQIAQSLDGDSHTLEYVLTSLPPRPQNSKWRAIPQTRKLFGSSTLATSTAATINLLAITMVASSYEQTRPAKSSSLQSQIWYKTPNWDVSVVDKD